MNRHIWQIIIFILLINCSTLLNAQNQDVIKPYETDKWSIPGNIVDSKVEDALTKAGIKMRNSCSDEVFMRRVYLDMIGTLPNFKEVDSFIKDTNPNKRTALIESLFQREEFADYLTLRWCDLLRVKSEFPINLWPNAVQAYHHWIRDAIKKNMPYDQFVRELLTSSGSNFRVPAANFYRAVPSKDPVTIAKTVALNFMGTRFEKWPEQQQKDMTAFFSRIAYKKTGEWKEEIVYLNPAITDAAQTKFPDGTPATIAANSDPRLIFADWLLAPGNKWFARNIVNRVWAWTMGRGIINEPDDIRPDNPPASAETLAMLEAEFIKSKYDIRQLYRLILNSRTYQQSSIPHNDTANDSVQFAHYSIRRLDAEVLIDALCWVGGNGESYTSAIPEPFTYIPKENHSIALADGSITSTFLMKFGRPTRDTGMESERNNHPSEDQALYLLNSSDIQRRIDNSPRLLAVNSMAKGNKQAIIRWIYLPLLTRFPTPAEMATAEKYFQTPGLQTRQAQSDLAWAIINSKEFLYKH